MPGWLLREMRPGESMTMQFGDKLLGTIRVTQTRRGRLTVGVQAHPVIILRHEAAPPEEPPCPDPQSSMTKP